MLVPAARTCFLMALFALGAVGGWAQNPTLGKSQPLTTAAWLSLAGDARIADHWGTHAEAQWRQAKGVGAAHQNLLRLGLTYHATAALQLTAGYGLLLTAAQRDAPGTVALPEHRLYEQLVINDSQNRLQLQHRYRLEQRWVQLAEQTAPTYLNRIRYQLRLTYPLSGPTLKPGGAYAVAADELFLGFGRHVEHGIFDQNRAYAALGYQVLKSLAVEVGYQNQLAPPNSAATFGSTHSVQLGLQFSPDFRPAALLTTTQEAGAKEASTRKN
ncbi:DUF2490 domain-containing protein [Hymenobacter chitinivorans]|uniref:Uncharacterized protein DUF2490 n=1 Tax=Hymenobacter chitinivorans DSM 11115 TaxID=1121954 RepID=A0A2M9BA13_9BACT|nr:DUF2490 domain-containing protein [Hymenobacter chitinivorans]PJJ54783.1 uncharacterized protein DUF2490 [Hymenobacter chitinivorans DSM 11115]